MDAYPYHYVAHNLPFVTLFGLDSGEHIDDAAAAPITDDSDRPHFEANGFSYRGELPAVSGDAAVSLRQAFRDLDARDASWNSRPGPGKMGSVGFTYRDSGGTLTLPPHKAPEPIQSQLEDLPASWSPVTHSPISPLTPSSPLYPDGILTPAWMAKHQSLLPTAIICFFTFTVDATRSSLEDNALKGEINRLKSWFNETRYATRVVVVLVCDESAHISTVVERLGNIRRATNLDTKTLLYMPAGLSIDESRAFVGSLLSNIHATCIEYYRDLSKHARRKKNRGSTPPPTIPPTSGTSQVLSARGWNLRYETKLGVFAEFRGEMDAAERSYEQAYEDLMDGDIFEGISNWSPRFNEARLLADVLAIRILRCLLWTNQTTSAAQSWSNHKHRMQDLIDNKGKGIGTYAWPAWEATWSRVMAEVIEKVQIPFFHVPDPTDESPLMTANIHAPPERTISRDILISPADRLHHQGYWYERSARKVQLRRKLATNLPTEDRRAPGESPASTLASRSHMYDTYLAPEPHQEYIEAVKTKGAHSQLILSSLGQAEAHADRRQQKRTVARLRLEIAEELANQGEWMDASRLVKLILEEATWRREGWWHLLGSVYVLAYRCFSQTKDAEALLATSWQLQSAWLEIPDHRRPLLKDWARDLTLEDAVRVRIDADASAPCIAAQFTFGAGNACVGDPLHVQLTLVPFLHSSTSPITLKRISVKFKGSINTVVIDHEETAAVPSVHSTECRFQKVDLQQSEESQDSENVGLSLSGSAQLDITHGTSSVYQFSVVPRESQELSAEYVELTVEAEGSIVELSTAVQEPAARPHWWRIVDGKPTKDILDLQEKTRVEVKPRPPKMKITLPDLRETYYTDETAALTIRLDNEESESADVRLKVHTFHGSLSADVRWSDMHDSQALVSEAGSTLPQRDVGGLEASQSRDFQIGIAKLSDMGKIVLEVEAVYTLINDPNTIITKSMSQEVSFARPFESNYESRCGVHPDLWPSLFDASTQGGLAQRYYVTARVLAYTSEAVLVDDIELRQTEPAEETVTCAIESDRPRESSSVVLQPQELRNCTFTVDARKTDIEDRQHVDLQFSLRIKWRRQVADESAVGSSSLPVNITTLPALTLRLDFGKPRVLAAAKVLSLRSGPSAVRGTHVVNMTYTIENPSDYMLQFSVAMDATEQFAFSGTKMTTIQLTPLSRAQVRFTLLPLQYGVWISPVVRVTDIGFGEVLRIHGAEGVRQEKGRCLVWVPPPDE